jgi:hypothetical protein
VANGGISEKRRNEDFYLKYHNSSLPHAMSENLVHASEFKFAAFPAQDIHRIQPMAYLLHEYKGKLMRVTFDRRVWHRQNQCPIVGFAILEE